MSEYATFVASKGKLRREHPSIDMPASALNPMLFDWQREIVSWALRRGRAALLEECGLGKTAQELEWSTHVAAHTGKPVLILAPLAVAPQTVREGAKFGVPVTICRSQADIRAGVNVANYEMLDHFDLECLGGIVTDEASILKSYMGVTKRKLVDRCASIPFRLAATATPAPNDHMEIGNYAEWLGIMKSSEMLMRWFINDTMAMGSYKLKGHAVAPFWDWVASWAVAARRPSDLGYADAGFNLPELVMHQVTVPVDWTAGAGDSLFRQPDLNATSIHKEMRLTAPARAQAVADLVNASAETWLIWCNTNYESDELMARIRGATEVRGSEPTAIKEAKLDAFATGKQRILVTKPSIAGLGLNLQICSHVAFVGLSYSFEDLHQAIRRTWRYGQTKPVHTTIITAESEGAVLNRVQAKMASYTEMMDAMVQSTARLRHADNLRLVDYAPSIEMSIPDWLVAS